MALWNFWWCGGEIQNRVWRSEITNEYFYHLYRAGQYIRRIGISGANPFSGTIPLTITTGVPVTQVIRIERAMVSTQYAFEGLKFLLYPECEEELARQWGAKEVILSVYFENAPAGVDILVIPDACEEE